MITPDKIQALADPVEEIYIHMVDDLLINIGKHLISPTWTHTAAWEIQKLAELGQLTDENAAIINRWIKSIPAEMRQTMESTRAEALDRLEAQFEKAVRDGHITPAMNDSVAQVLTDYLEQATDKLNMVNTTMLQSSLDQYSKAVQLTADRMRRKEATQSVLNEAAGKVAMGTETRTEAVRKALRQISSEGLTGFYDRSGRSWSPEAYVNMVVRSTVHNTAIQATRARMEDYGTQVFQVSSHHGARPLCYPYQGKFYSWDNSSGVIELGDGRNVSYEPLNVTSYGQAAGLFGINCGHEPIPIIPSVTIPHGEDQMQSKEENDKLYAESQQQRALERQIRDAKRLVAMGDDSPEAKAKVKAAQAEMRDFIKETGRTRRYDREQIVGALNRPSGQSTGNGSSKPGMPEKIGTVDFSDKKAVMTVLRKAEKECVDLPYEVNTTVDTAGNVWRTKGTENGVNFELIPHSLKDSYSYHNHTVNKTHHSLSAEDLWSFYEYSQAYSGSSDYRFRYAMRKTVNTVEISSDEAYNMFREIYDNQILKESFEGTIDIDVDGFHETMKILSERLCFEYERKEKGKP